MEPQGTLLQHSGVSRLQQLTLILIENTCESTAFLGLGLQARVRCSM